MSPGAAPIATAAAPKKKKGSNAAKGAPAAATAPAAKAASPAPSGAGPIASPPPGGRAAVTTSLRVAEPGPRYEPGPGFEPVALPAWAPATPTTPVWLIQLPPDWDPATTITLQPAPAARGCPGEEVGRGAATDGHTYALFSEAPSTAAGVHVFGAGGAALPVAGRATLVRVGESSGRVEVAAAATATVTTATPPSTAKKGGASSDKKKRRERERDEGEARAARKEERKRAKAAAAAAGRGGG